MEYVSNQQTATDNTTDEYGVQDRYRQLRFTLLMVITIFSMIPATLMSVTGYFQYLSLLERQEITQIEWHIQYTQDKIGEYLETNGKNETISPGLKKVLATINQKVLDDTFLMDKQGKLLTASTHFQDTFPLPINLNDQEIIEQEQSFGRGKTFLAISPIKDSPWILVLVKDGPIHEDEWWQFQLKLIGIFMSCTVISLLVVYHLVNLLTYRIRMSDVKRMTLFSEIGHNNRLATIGRLAAGVAHEINNPLAVIDQKAGLIEDYLEFTGDFPHKEKFQTAVQGINSNVVRCKKITHRLLGFARKVGATFESVNINTIIQEVLGFLEKEALYNHIQLELDLDHKLPDIYSDHGQLQQILLNIINNAIDAIGQSGIISITTRMHRKKMIKITIRDNGPGIPPEIMKHIFDPFFTTKETGKGTGLGLAITHGLITKLGGDIKVKSTPDTETVFSLYLPVDHHKQEGIQ